MRYYLDTEFNEFGGALISIGLVREDGESLYIVYDWPTIIYGNWVKDNVVPILWDIPSPLPGGAYSVNTMEDGARIIADFLNQSKDTPVIITDWPDDIKYFCQALITAPGEMVDVPRILFDMVRVNSYPTSLKGAIQHNAWWDARALWWLLEKKESDK